MYGSKMVYWDESVGKLHIRSDSLMFHYIIYHEALCHKPFICSLKKLGTLILTVDYIQIYRLNH